MDCLLSDLFLVLDMLLTFFVWEEGGGGYLYNPMKGCLHVNKLWSLYFYIVTELFLSKSYFQHKNQCGKGKSVVLLTYNTLRNQFMQTAVKNSVKK